MNTVKKVKIYVGILAGGQGTRLWPLSTPQCPKPFVPLGPIGSLFEGTVARAKALSPAKVFTVGAASLKGFCPRSLGDFLVEPAGRNTAAAVALAGAHAWKLGGGKGQLLILPADHYIPDAAHFARTVAALSRVCEAYGSLGVMGIKPTGPETAYGYIEQGELAGEGFRVARFIEKPDRAKAEALLATGKVSWNSGMFLYPLEILRAQMDAHCPGYWEAAERWTEKRDDGPYLDLNPISVDYALMEKTDRVAMIPADFTWSDLGTFPSLHGLLPKDDHGNTGWGPGHVEACRNCLIVTKRRGTLVRGMEGMVVVETDGGLLAVPLDKSEGIRAAVEAILREEQG